MKHSNSPLISDWVVPLIALFVMLNIHSSDLRAQTLPDFTISEAYLRSLADKSSIIADIPVRFTHRTKSVHALSADCEMHLAGKPNDPALGSPAAIVVEPPNLCKFEHDSGEKWPAVFDDRVLNRNCIASGYPRIFTEHAKGSEGGANPNHVFEIHPATKIKCGDNTISFASYLTYFPGMRAIKPSSADNCVRTRSVSVRYNSENKEYEFTERGGGSCGNFAVVEVGFVEPKWVQQIGGGHSAIARVSLNGESRTTLKIYTLEGSEADTWLASVKENGPGDDRIYLHGMLTYDYFAFVKAVRTVDGQWQQPADWKDVPFPFALVVFGMPSEAPWDEHEDEEALEGQLATRAPPGSATRARETAVGETAASELAKAIIPQLPPAIYDVYCNDGKMNVFGPAPVRFADERKAITWSSSCVTALVLKNQIPWKVFSSRGNTYSIEEDPVKPE